MTNGYSIPFRNRLARSTLRPVFRGLFHILGKVEINGLENIPQKGAYLVTPNHISLYDGPLVAVFWPVPLEIAGASDVWDRPGQGQLARLYGGIKVHRGQYDRKLIDTLLSILHSGFPLLLAPEGRRSHNVGMQRANPGIAYLVDKSGVPVIPVGVFGTTEDFMQKALQGKRPMIGMNVGKPLTLPPLVGKGDARRKSRRDNADFVMAHIAALLPPEYRGVYADHLEYLNGVE